MTRTKEQIRKEKLLDDLLAIRADMRAPMFTDRSKRVLTEYVLQGKSLEEIGKPLGITRERVRQILQRDLGKLKEQYAEDGPS